MLEHMDRHDADTVTALEESLWRAETRSNSDYMERILAADFVEFGRSGRTYTRAQSIAIVSQLIDATVPLCNLRVVRLDRKTVQVTYVSEVRVAEHTVERANRSSIWSRTADGWELRFHQGTPTT